MPDALASQISVAIVTDFHAGRQMFEQLGIAAAKHDIVGLERNDQTIDHVEDVLAPPLLA